MSPNLHLIQQRCAKIRVLLRQLQEVKELPVEIFSSNTLLVDATLYRLMRGIEAAQAICTHLAARVPTRTPSPTSLAGSPPLFSYQVSLGELLDCKDEVALANWREKMWNEYFRFQPHRERLVQDWLAS
jgi:hypothetical protein